MKVLGALKEWLFYGHIWIALGAVGLGWLSVRLAFQTWVYEFAPLSQLWQFLFFATLGVYTLHRLLSFKKASVIPETVRYRLVKKHPVGSLLIGYISLLYAGFLLIPHLGWHLLPSFVLAIPATLFYLIPPVPGWRRLRDLPYVKVLFVALAWTFITHDLAIRLAQDFANTVPLELKGSTDIEPNAWLEYPVRFCFILAVALLFDCRDVDLDRLQSVRTVANTYPRLLKWLVPGLLALCTFLSMNYTDGCTVPHALGTVPALAYLSMILIAVRTVGKTDEDWYAIVVNGLLLLPPIAYLLAKG